MKPFVAILLLLAAVGILRAASPRRTFLDRYKASVAVMYGTDTPTDPKSLVFGCTMTAIEKVADGYLFLTAGHCVEDDIPPGMVFFAGDDQPNGERYIAEVVAAGDQMEGYDFSVLHVKAPRGAFTVTPLGHNPRQIGERVYTISVPKGVGIGYLEGTIQILSLPPYTAGGEDLTKIEDNSFWAGDIGMEIFGEAPGSSGSSMICTDQQKICGLIIGHIEGCQVSEPIERFEKWWQDVQAGKIPKMPPKPQVPPKKVHVLRIPLLGII